MKKINFFIIFLLTVNFVSAQTEVIMNVGTIKRQKLVGTGASLTDNIDNIPESARKAMSDLVYRDMHMNTMRLWKHDQNNFWKHYVNTNAIKWAREGGVTTLLLAPGGKNPETNMTAYANEIATIAKRLRTETDFPLNVTGVANEPDFWTAANIADGITKIRAALDANGDQSVKIIAPESSNCDDHWYGIMNEVKTKYPAAWNLQDYIGSHSYEMCTLEKWGKFSFDNNKEYWMTESSNNGDDSETDDVEGTVMAGRFLNDMNHGISKWIYFIAYSSDVNDSKTKFVVWDAKKNKIRIFCKYYYMKQMFTNYHVGAVFRKVLANGTGEMNQTYGSKSRYNAAVAQNPDGTWNLSVVNGTGAQDFSPETYKFTFDMPELASAGNIDFKVLRTNVSQKLIADGIVTMINGRVSIVVNAKEVVTLTNGTIQTHVPVTDFNIEPQKINMSLLGTYALNPTIIPEDATIKEIIWKSSNNGVVKVSDAGVLTALLPGTVTITGTTVDGAKVSTCTVTVKLENKLSGTKISSGASDATTDESKVFDGDFTTYFNANEADNAWVGLDFGTERIISTVKISPRIGFPARIIGGIVQTSNTADFSNTTDLFTITSTLTENAHNFFSNSNTTPFRYVRYLSPVGGYGNISELQFWTDPLTAINKLALSNFEVFPNPMVNGNLTVKFSGLENQQTVYLKIMDMLGKVVFMMELSSSELNNQFLTIESSNFKSGIYTLSLVTNSGSQTTKLLVK